MKKDISLFFQYLSKKCWYSRIWLLCTRNDYSPKGIWVSRIKIEYLLPQASADHHIQGKRECENLLPNISHRYQYHHQVSSSCQNFCLIQGCQTSNHQVLLPTAVLHLNQHLSCLINIIAEYKISSFRVITHDAIVLRVNSKYIGLGVLDKLTFSPLEVNSTNNIKISMLW